MSEKFLAILVGLNLFAVVFNVVFGVLGIIKAKNKTKVELMPEQYGEKLENLASEFRAVIDKYCQEYDFTYPEILGVLELIKDDLLDETRGVIDEYES